VTTSDRRSSDSSTASVYWRDLSSPTSLLISTSRTSIYVSDRGHMRTTRIVVIPGRSHPLSSIRAKYQTTAIARLYRQLIQRLRDTRQEQNRIILQSQSTSPSYGLSLPPYIQFSALQPRASRMLRNHDLRDRGPEHRCIEYHQYERAEHERCIAKKQRRHALRVLHGRHALNRSYRFKTGT